METYQLRFCLQKMLIFVMNDRLASYIFGQKLLPGEPTQQFLHDTITTGPIVKKGGATVFVSSVCNCCLAIKMFCIYWQQCFFHFVIIDTYTFEVCIFK